MLLSPAAVTLAFFGPAQILEDTFSGGKAMRGDAEVVVFNFADVGLIYPEHVVIGSA